MQSYATAKPSVGLLPSMGGLCFYDRERQLPWVPGSGFLVPQQYSQVFVVLPQK